MPNFYNLDYDKLKTEIKEFIQANSAILKDYNFEGSAISAMNNVQAFITQQILFYLNMISNEMFISSAEIEENVYRAANALNYIPKRKSSPYIDVSMVAASTITLDRFTAFGTDASVTLYYMGDDISVGTATIDNIRLYEGDKLTATLDFTNSDVGEFNTFTLSDGIEIENDFFYVTDEIDDAWKCANLEPFNVGDKAYYFNQSTGTLTLVTDNGKTFEDPVAEGRTLVLEYIKSTGTENNGTAIGSITHSSITIPSTGNLASGSDEDTIADIKLKAPLFFNTKYRAVTQNDYNTVIQNYGSYPDYDGLFFWGGETEYVDAASRVVVDEELGGGIYDKGYLYYSGLKDGLAYINTVSDSASIEGYVDQYRVISLLYRYVDPKIVNIDSDISIRYNYNATDTQKDAVEADIVTYLSGLSGLNVKFRKSDLIRTIDEYEGVDYVYATLSSYVESRGFIESDPTYAIRLGNEIDAAVAISGTVDGLVISNSGADFLVDGIHAGTISHDSGEIFLETGTLTDAYEFSFDYSTYEYIQVEKDTYLNFNTPTISRL